jgi:ATP-binding cassette subfamily G (WHITE) protein 2 (PDR)
MSRNFRGETVYNAESDVHFPHLTVKQTLEFASALRMPRNRVVGLSREEHIRQTTAVAMAMCGLTDAQDTKVGNDYVRGVSGGERKVI